MRLEKRLVLVGYVLVAARAHSAAAAAAAEVGCIVVAVQAVDAVAEMVTAESVVARMSAVEAGRQLDADIAVWKWVAGSHDKVLHHYNQIWAQDSKQRGCVIDSSRGKSWKTIATIYRLDLLCRV